LSSFYLPARRYGPYSPPLHGSPAGFDVLAGVASSVGDGSAVLGSTAGGVLVGALAAGFFAQAAHKRMISRLSALTPPCYRMFMPMVAPPTRER
jgi:hypothetical protein